MQGKEASEQETGAQSTVGIDVSKSWLDAHVLPAGESLRVANAAQGIAKLKRWLARFELGLVVVEATGGYERGLVFALQSAGVCVARVNPRQARDFAKSMGVLAKTDQVDARVLRDFGDMLARHRDRHAGCRRL